MVLDYVPGVSNIYYVDSMIRNKWYELYDKIIVRRLDIVRDTQFLTKV